MQTVDDRQRILEQKARTYDALRSGRQYDEDDRYHVQFRAGGQLPAEGAASLASPGSSSQPLWQGTEASAAARPQAPGMTDGHMHALQGFRPWAERTAAGQPLLDSPALAACTF